MTPQPLPAPAPQPPQSPPAPPQPPPAPTARQLVRATITAVAAASVILFTIVLPAEYGWDPTGAGRALGIYRPAAAVAQTPQGQALPDDATAVSSTSFLRRDAPFRTDTMHLTLRPGEGAEIKAAMRRGERFVFTWTAAGGGVDVDMHGDVAGAPADDYTSYLKAEFQTSGHGAFEAPAAGNYGWFWQNLNDDPVTVTVTTSGFYETLFRPSP